MLITSQNAQEHEIGRFICEASDLGLPPGKWPPRLETNLGNGRDFIFMGSRVENGEVVCWNYRQQMGCIALNVYND